MKLSDTKKHLATADAVNFKLQTGGIPHEKHKTQSTQTACCTIR